MRNKWYKNLQIKKLNFFHFKCAILFSPAFMCAIIVRLKDFYSKIWYQIIAAYTTRCKVPSLSFCNIFNNNESITQARGTSEDFALICLGMLDHNFLKWKFQRFLFWYISIINYMFVQGILLIKESCNLIGWESIFS